MKYPQIKEITNHLRKNTTPAKEKLWKYLRKKQLDDRKFLWQHAIIYVSDGD
jgi:very-short-patch-repair endonuclease